MPSERKESTRYFGLNGGYRVRETKGGFIEITRWHAPDDAGLAEKLTIMPEQIRELADKLELVPTARQVSALSKLVPR